jgi:glycosyltransferase involved in cell wall biosynthesis
MIKAPVKQNKVDCSVVIPFYNRHDTILKSVESALAFNFVNEVIVIDDSSDNKINIEFFDKTMSSEKIKVLSNRFTKGAQGARLTGVQSATNDYIIFLDSDDYLNENGTRSLFQTIIENKDLALVYGNVSINEKITNYVRLDGNCFYEVLKDLSLCPYSGIIINKALIDWKLFDLALPSCQDDDFILMVSKFNKICFVNIIMAHMKTSINSISLESYNKSVGFSMLLKKWRGDIVKEFGVGRLALWKIRQVLILNDELTNDIKLTFLKKTRKIVLLYILYILLKIFGKFGRYLISPFFNRLNG